MTYKIVLTDRFKAHLETLGDYIAKASPVNARRWIEELERQLQKLEKSPAGYPPARENQSHKIGLRQMLYGKGRNKYRVIFTIKETEVVVLDIRHGARKELPPGSLGVE